jgi:hypothetical protein
MSAFETPEQPESSKPAIVCACLPLIEGKPAPTTLRCHRCVALVRDRGYRLLYCEIGDHGMVLPPSTGRPRRCSAHAGEAA